MNRREAWWWHFKHVLLHVIGTIICTAILCAAIYGILWIVSLVE